MITNLVARLVVTLGTNAVSSDNAVMVPDYGFMLTTYPGQYAMRVGTPATEQYLTTNVTEHSEVTVLLADGPHTFTSDRLLSSVTAVLRKLEEWQPAGVRTNEVGGGFSGNNWWTPEMLTERWINLLNFQATNTNAIAWQRAPAWNLDLLPSGSTNRERDAMRPAR